MNKTPLQKMMPAFTLFYLGLICLLLPYFYNITYLTPIFTGLGIFCLILSALTLFYYKLCRKIDAISIHIPNMNRVGIEQIIPANSDTFSFLEKLASSSNSVKIAINIQRLTDKFCYFLDSLLENDIINYQIIILGQSDESKKLFFVEDLCKREKNNVKIKTVDEPQIDNLMIFDRRSCIMNYNDYDNKLSFLILFDSLSENNRKNRKFFDFLWDGAELTANDREGE